MKLLRISSIAVLTGLLLAFIAPVANATPNDKKIDKQEASVPTSADRSQELVAILDYIADFDTEEEWRDNYDYLRPYVELAASIVKSGDYDPTYSVLPTLLSDFELKHAYFSNRALNEHLAYLNAEILRYESCAHYFEKYGIALGIRDYIVENKLDTTLPAVQAISEQNNYNLECLALEEESYDKLLSDNAAAFVSATESLENAEKYTDILMLVNAASKYVYDMDVSVDGVSEGLIILEESREKLELIRRESQELIRLSVLLTYSHDYDFLAVVIDITPYIEKADVTVDGVSDALVTYNTEIDKYNDGIARTNQEIDVSYKTALYLANTKKSRRPIAYLLDTLD